MTVNRGTLASTTGAVLFAPKLSASAPERSSPQHAAPTVVTPQVNSSPAVSCVKVTRSTETAALPGLAPGMDAVIIADPGATPVTTPVVETVATSGSALDHVTE